MLRPCLMLAAIVWPAVSPLAQQLQRDAIQDAGGLAGAALSNALQAQTP